MKFLRDELQKLTNEQLLRTLPNPNNHPSRFIHINGHRLVNFSSNNYLGLANHEALIQAAHDALSSGTGSSGSRLLTGNLSYHEQLESQLAAFHNVPAARLFNSGYHANIGVITSLAGPADLIVSDQLNHASIVDGSRLSRAKICIAKHGDITSFASHLQREQNFRRKIVVTDSVFSMDGDLAPLVELRALCDQHQAILIVDEAHGLGVFGRHGAGLCADLNIVPDVLVGGFGKAFGSCGGYVAGSRELCDYLLQRARSFMFSTALPGSVVAATLAALTVFQSEEGVERRSLLAARINQFRQGLHQLGLLVCGSGMSSIFPLIVEDAMAAVELAESLAIGGVYCQAIRPPTVPAGTARVRLSVSALHSEPDVSLVLRLLSAVMPLKK